jgi:hypothetical protein
LVGDLPSPERMGLGHPSRSLARLNTVSKDCSMRGSVQREVQGAGPRRRLRTAGRSPSGSGLRRAAGRRGQGQRRWSRSAVRAGPSPTCAAYLEGRPRLPRPASTASAVAPCAPLRSTSCPTTARPTTRPHLPRAVVTLDTPGKFAEFLRVTELDDAEWATSPQLPPCTAKPFDGPQGVPTVPGAAQGPPGVRDGRLRLRFR